MKISLVIPVKDEAESLPFLQKEIDSVLAKAAFDWEIIYINDGSTDNSLTVLKKLAGQNSKIRIISFPTNRGKSPALAAGFAQASGEIIATLDADLQDDPAELPKFLKKIYEGYDLVSGWRHQRRDTLTKRVSSWLFNRGTAFITGVKLHDFNCGLKVFRKTVADELFLYGELHRFIPILAAKKNFRVTELPINHRKRRFGKTKYGFERGWKGIIDLMTAVFLTDYSTKPAHFFGKIGLLLFGFGFSIGLYITFIKVTTGTTQGKIPLLLAGILFMVLGFQSLSTGLIAEMITYFSRKS